MAMVVIRRMKIVVVMTMSEYVQAERRASKCCCIVLHHTKTIITLTSPPHNTTTPAQHYTNYTTPHNTSTPRRKSLKRRVDFWLSRLHQLSFKPADEFSCLLRSIYNRQYSEALLRYNRFSRPSLPSCLPVRSCAPL